MNNKTKNTLRAGLLTLILAGTVSGCGSCTNWWNDVSRNVSKRDYHLTLYAADGTIIKDDDLRDTYIEVSENGSGLRYIENGKLVMLNGTYILKER